MAPLHAGVLLALPVLTPAVLLTGGVLAGDRSIEEGPGRKHAWERRPQPLQNFTLEYRQSVNDCLKGKSVFFMGNDVSRHWWYVVRDVLDGTDVRLRKMPTDEAFECGQFGEQFGCKRGETCPMSGCETEAGSTFPRTLLRFLWQKKLLEDGAEGVLRNCPDLVTMNAGGGDILDEARRPTWRELQEEQAPQLRKMLQKVLGACPNSHVIWRTTTPLCGQFYGLARSEANAMIDQSNAIITKALEGLPRTQIFDVGSRNAGRCSMYDDGLHHHALVEEHVRELLGHYCSSLGTPL